MAGSNPDNFAGSGMAGRSKRDRAQPSWNFVPWPYNISGVTGGT